MWRKRRIFTAGYAPTFHWMAHRPQSSQHPHQQQQHDHPFMTAIRRATRDIEGFFFPAQSKICRLCNELVLEHRQRHLGSAAHSARELVMDALMPLHASGGSIVGVVASWPRKLRDARALMSRGLSGSMEAIDDVEQRCASVRNSLRLLRDVGILHQSFMLPCTEEGADVSKERIVGRHMAMERLEQLGDNAWGVNVCARLVILLPYLRWHQANVQGDATVQQLNLLRDFVETNENVEVIYEQFRIEELIGSVGDLATGGSKLSTKTKADIIETLMGELHVVLSSLEMPCDASGGAAHFPTVLGWKCRPSFCNFIRHIIDEIYDLITLFVLRKFASEVLATLLDATSNALFVPNPLRARPLAKKKAARPMSLSMSRLEREVVLPHRRILAAEKILLGIRPTSTSSEWRPPTQFGMGARAPFVARWLDREERTRTHYDVSSSEGIASCEWKEETQIGLWQRERSLRGAEHARLASTCENALTEQATISAVCDPSTKSATVPEIFPPLCAMPWSPTLGQLAHCLGRLHIVESVPTRVTAPFVVRAFPPASRDGLRLMGRGDVSIPFLVVLDINGVLGHRKKKSFIIRPGVEHFLSFLFENFAVGAWTSMTQVKAEPIIDDVFDRIPLEKLGRGFGSLLQFRYFRHHCDANPTADDPYGTIKDLRKVLQALIPPKGSARQLDAQRNPLCFPPPPTFTAHNIIMIDDSDIKCAQRSNCLCPDTFLEPSLISSSSGNQEGHREQQEEEEGSCFDLTKVKEVLQEILQKQSIRQPLDDAKHAKRQKQKKT